MKVLLIQDVENLGLAGEVQNVADGYGRNYLIPQRLAVLATPGELKKTDLHRRRAAEQRQRIADELAALAEAIRQTTLTFQAKAGEKGRLYGSITTADIAAQLTAVLGKEMDRRKMTLETPIKLLGTHKVTIRLSADVTAEFNVEVQPLEPVAEEAPEEPSTEE